MFVFSSDFYLVFGPNVIVIIITLSTLLLSSLRTHTWFPRTGRPRPCEATPAFFIVVPVFTVKVFSPHLACGVFQAEDKTTQRLFSVLY